jgi:hypothetical protein
MLLLLHYYKRYIDVHMSFFLGILIILIITIAAMNWDGLKGIFRKRRH